MVGHVEQLDDLPLDLDGLGDPDRRPEAAGDPLGDAGLAVAGIAVKEQASARVDGRTEQPERLLRDQQVGKRPPQVVFLGVLGGDRLRGHRPKIVVKRNRGGPDVGAFVEVHLGPRPSGVGQRIHIIIGRCRIGVGEELLVLEPAEEVGKRAETADPARRRSAGRRPCRY